MGSTTDKPPTSPSSASSNNNLNNYNNDAASSFPTKLDFGASVDIQDEMRRTIRAECDEIDKAASITQTAVNHKGDPNCAAILAGFMNTPEPITLPMTSAMVER